MIYIYILQRLCKDICTNPFEIIDKMVTKELKTIIANCNEKKVGAHIHIQRVGNAILNAQQMLAQLVTYIVLFIL